MPTSTTSHQRAAGAGRWKSAQDVRTLIRGAGGWKRVEEWAGGEEESEEEVCRFFCRDVLGAYTGSAASSIAGAPATDAVV